MRHLRLTITELPLNEIPPGYPMSGKPQRQKYHFEIHEIEILQKGEFARTGENKTKLVGGVTSDPLHALAVMQKKSCSPGNENRLTRQKGKENR